MKIVELDESILGEQLLLRPYEVYKAFFHRRIEQSSGPTAVALKAANVASAIFAYPCFGVLAALNLVKNLYTTPDLAGDLLTQPLKGFHRFFAKKIEQAPGWRKAAYATAAAAASIFAYPAFGTLALAGMFVKLLGVPFLLNHNKNIKEDFKDYIEGGAFCKRSAGGFSREDSFHGHALKTVEQITFRLGPSEGTYETTGEKELLRAFDQEIDTISALFRWVNINCAVLTSAPNNVGAFEANLSFTDWT